ncbi:hypothetical protein M406DRAFT_354213 [Cryphonectria parasitica EP155]|uniref:TMEM205-like domain-containing protein n=1 Tax=Cryphonectria parasitica (strain ATCC 38755 / EP155) TaxID=660469 RepID=A0A9P5CSV5_CRYP1|nr:uncharacterized protein M406DRAFT_354213 [Cryphonectria parasitica EP155]KAF3769999.1 hypothetical protein M406DRAFT_354213 [Cryphonectria parasitica EP155]
MPRKSIMLTGAPYHILAYGSLLGTTVFNTCVGTIIQFKTLPILQFSDLQTKTFPWYFGLQTTLPVILAVTLPGRGPFGASGGLQRLFNASNRWSTLVPLATVFVTGLANWVVLLPASKACIVERRKQEEKDGKRSWDPKPHSQEMTALNKKFGMLHGISSLLNVVNFVATVVYGVTLARRIR